jgi:hypothetical protein
LQETVEVLDNVQVKKEKNQKIPQFQKVTGCCTSLLLNEAGRPRDKTQDATTIVTLSSATRVKSYSLWKSFEAIEA